jgi:biopolymer transport protein TolR
MAQIEDSGKSERTVAVDVNLVPFIDLMSVCIIFLLVTAVWTQVSMIQLGSSIYAKRNDSGEVEPPPRPDVMIKVDIRPDGYVVNVSRNATSIAKKADGKYDVEKLRTTLMQVKQLHPEKNDAILTVADELSYEEMVRGMDTLLNSGFGEVAISTGEEG